MKQIWYGGDYNPEQWPRELWDEDVRLMVKAGVTVATVGVFSWAQLEPEDGRFEFSWLDDIIGRLHAAGIRIDLATATASPPPWLALAHPDILPVTADGVRLSIGSRQHYSPSSATYLRYAARLVRKLGERYHDHPALEAWHVNNELACHVRRDYSDESATAFRVWLRRRYGDIAALNAAWGTAFWSQSYSTFDEIMPPRAMPTNGNPTQLLDFDRFSSDAWLGVYRAEASILREVSPGVPITTNFMGFFPGGDYWAWAQEVDFVSDDHYVDPADPIAPAYAAMTRDLMRSLGGGRPWILMEQATSAVNWRARNAAIPPGMHRALSLQAVARGADGIMQFQWRQSVAGAEKFHSAMVPHAGENSRIYRETVELGQDLAALSDVIGSRVHARVAILFSWESWWAHEQQATPTRLDYVRTVFRWYEEFWRRNIMTDFARPGADLSKYDLVVAPATAVLDAPARAELARFVDAGGHLVATYATGILDENLHFPARSHLGELGELLGVRIEEFAPPAEPSVSGGPIPKLSLGGLGAGTAGEWAEVLRAESATVLSCYSGGTLDGSPAITRRLRGEGVAWYVSTLPDDLESLLDEVLSGTVVEPTVDGLPAGVEAVRRGDRLFLINHTGLPVRHGGFTLPEYGASVAPIAVLGIGEELGKPAAGAGEFRTM